FADDQSEIGDGNYNNADGHRLGIRSDDRIGKQEILKPLGERGAAERTSNDGGERHSDLYAGQEALGIVRKGQCSSRTSSAVCGKLLETPVPRIDHGKLGHGEKAIQQDEK